VETVPGRNQTMLERALDMPSIRNLRKEAELPLPEDLQNLMEMYKELSRYEEGEALYLMPYTEEELGVSSK
jgi:hypothetical protein